MPEPFRSLRTGALHPSGDLMCMQRYYPSCSFHASWVLSLSISRDRSAAVCHSALIARFFQRCLDSPTFQLSYFGGSSVTSLSSAATEVRGRHSQHFSPSTYDTRFVPTHQQQLVCFNWNWMTFRLWSSCSCPLRRKPCPSPRWRPAVEILFGDD